MLAPASRKAKPDSNDHMTFEAHRFEAEEIGKKTA